MKKLLVITLFFLFATVNTVKAINTKDWEGVLAIQLFQPQPTEAWVVKTAQLVLKKAFPGKGVKFFEKHYDTQKHIFLINIQSRWHDLDSFAVTYFPKKSGGYAYSVFYFFVPDKMALLDVIGRYGAQMADIQTEEDLSKVIIYHLTERMPSMIGKNPLWPLIPAHSGQRTELHFISKDGVFVDKLVIFTSFEN